jgi:steroid delta-isomerase-like uncharacterized protein
MARADDIVTELYTVVWNEGDLGAVERLVAYAYTIHSDPGDPWEGQTLDHQTYRQRVLYSRRAFPDLQFTIQDMIVAADRVAVRWDAEGTHQADVAGLVATGRRLRFAGQTIYAVAEGLVSGHWQVIDRLGFLQQLRPGVAAKQQ